MAQFVYTAFVPSLEQNIDLKELSFSSYKQLVKLILNDNSQQILKVFDDLITACTVNKVSSLTFLDKIIILLTIRSVCIYPVLEFAYKLPQSKQEYNLKFEISTIIEKLNNKNFYKKYNNVVADYKAFEITYGIPEHLHYSNETDLILSTIKKIVLKKNKKPIVIEEIEPEILDQLPLTVYKDAKNHVKLLEEEISKTTLLSISMPEASQDQITVTPSVFNNSVLEFLKLAYQRDLFSLYELEYFLFSKLSLPFELISTSTYAELMLYIGFYTDETKRQQSSENKTGAFNPLNPISR
jgi:hypothetical protein